MIDINSIDEYPSPVESGRIALNKILFFTMGCESLPNFKTLLGIGLRGLGSMDQRHTFYLERIKFVLENLIRDFLRDGADHGRHKIINLLLSNLPKVVPLPQYGFHQVSTKKHIVTTCFVDFFLHVTGKYL